MKTLGRGRTAGALLSETGTRLLQGSWRILGTAQHCDSLSRFSPLRLIPPKHLWEAWCEKEFLSFFLCHDPAFLEMPVSSLS